MVKHEAKYRQPALDYRYFRKSANLSQLELAERAEISRIHLSNIEDPNVINPFTTTVLFNISDALGVELK